MNQVKETTQTNARIFLKNPIQNANKNHKKTGKSIKLPFQGKLISQKTLCRTVSRETLSVACVCEIHVYKNKKDKFSLLIINISSTTTKQH
jgi:hypothetical protein